MVPSESIKICVLGDEGVGKSSITLQFTQAHFPIDFDPTIEDIYTKDLTVNETTYRMHVLDTAAQDEYSHLKDLQFQQADGFILVFRLDSPESMGSAANSYRHIMRVHGELPPCILIGNKADLETDRLVSYQECEELVEELGLSKYFETSAKNNHNVNEAFTCLAETIINLRESKNIEPSPFSHPVVQNTDVSNDTLPTTLKSSATTSEEITPTLKKQQTFTIASSTQKIQTVEAVESASGVSYANQRSTQSTPQINEKTSSQTDGNKCCIIM